MHIHDPKTVRTADLYFAAYLSVAGVPMEDAKKEDRRVWFHFLDEGSYEDLKKQYYMRKAKINALQFVDEIKNFKNLTHEIMQGQ